MIPGTVHWHNQRGSRVVLDQAVLVAPKHVDRFSHLSASLKSEDFKQVIEPVSGCFEHFP
jgi:hypothetical protein